MSAIALDPLIAEARRRMRRRRVVAMVAMLFAIAVLGYVLLPSGSPSSTRSGQGTQSSQSLARLKVPLDSTERLWRSIVKSLGGPSIDPVAARRLRGLALSIVETTGAVPVRLKIWPGTSPAAVEIVAATRLNPAEYLRHRAVKFVNAFPRPVFVKIVDPHGRLIFEWGGAANTGFVGTPPPLENCSPVSNWGGFVRPPCPVR